MLVPSPQNLTKGFTIVELLIVIVVIGILAAITVVAFNGVQDRARVAAQQSDLTAGAKAIRLEMVASGNTVPLNTELRVGLDKTNTRPTGNGYVVCKSATAFAIIANPTATSSGAIVQYYRSDTGLSSMVYDIAAPGTYSHQKYCVQAMADYTYSNWSNLINL